MNSKSLMTAMCHRLRRTKRHADLREYVMGDEFASTLLAMTPLDRAVAVFYAAQIWGRHDAEAPLRPSPLSWKKRAEWTEDRIALLRRLAAMPNMTVPDIAREMRLPLQSVKRAKSRYCRSETSTATQTAQVMLQHADAR